MKRNQSPTIFPTVGNSAGAGNGEITESAPGGSRIPNLLIRSHWIIGSPVVAIQRLTYDVVRGRRADNATELPCNAASSHDFPHGFFRAIRHCIRRINRATGQVIARAGTAQKWTSAADRLTVDQRLDAARWAL